MWFIAALITLGATYLYRQDGQSSDEVAIACIPLVICGFPMAVAFAPWPVQLLILISVLISYPLTKSRASSYGSTRLR